MLGLCKHRVRSTGPGLCLDIWNRHAQCLALGLSDHFLFLSHPKVNQMEILSPPLGKNSSRPIYSSSLAVNRGHFKSQNTVSIQLCPLQEVIKNSELTIYANLCSSVLPFQLASQVVTPPGSERREKCVANEVLTGARGWPHAFWVSRC